MSNEISNDLEQRIRLRLENGRYQTQDELLRDALDALDQLEQEKLQRWHEGNRIAIEESRLGLSKPLDVDEVMARLRERLSDGSG